MSDELHVGDYVSRWAQPDERPDEDGQHRHLLFGEIAGFDGEAIILTETPTAACGLKLRDGEAWNLRSEAPKCPRCQEIADADLPKATVDIPIKRQKDLVPS